MAKKKKAKDRFAELSWGDITDWAGSRIVSRGKGYQRDGLVADLAVTDEGGLVAWVDGTRRYATRVDLDEEGFPDSACTCPYEWECKHAVAVVLEYLQRIEAKKRVPRAKADDERLALLAEEYWEEDLEDDGLAVGADGKDGGLSEQMKEMIDAHLKKKTKAQLIELIHELAEGYPEMARDLADRQQLRTGDTKAMVARLRKEIREAGSEAGWQDYWHHEGFTPDYSGIQQKLRSLLKAGHADEVLDLGKELVTSGMRQVEESHDDGETAMEIGDCMPIIVEALARSSLKAADKLAWALDVVMADQYDLCDPFAEYLHRKHAPAAWSSLADLLLARLKALKPLRGRDDFTGKFQRERLGDWAIHAQRLAGGGGAGGGRMRAPVLH